MKVVDEFLRDEGGGGEKSLTGGRSQEACSYKGFRMRKFLQGFEVTLRAFRQRFETDIREV